MEAIEEFEIVIIGGGLCGLATALALHRKGIQSVVLERSEHIRASGAAIGILSNGWRALDELGIGAGLRQTSLAIHRARDVSLGSGKKVGEAISMGEGRCLKRHDLITALASNLPHDTVRLGYHVISVQLDHVTSYPIIQLHNGSSIRAKILIGCDGVNSVVSDFLTLKPTKTFAVWAARGFTEYPNGHGLGAEFTRFRTQNAFMGRIPITDKQVYWFVGQLGSPQDANAYKDPELIRKWTLKSVNEFPAELREMLESSDSESLSLSQLRYRAPWDIMLEKFRKGTVTVAGDAMHVMGPFLGQGGSAGMEDAIVLARRIAQVINKAESERNKNFDKQIGEAIDEYVKERRKRLVLLSTQTYLMGLLLGNPPLFVKLICSLLMLILFSDTTSHTRYDCGSL